MMMMIMTGHRTNRSRTLASLVVRGESESFATETMITACCVDTDLITVGLVLTTLVSICQQEVSNKHRLLYSLTVSYTVVNIASNPKS